MVSLSLQCYVWTLEYTINASRGAYVLSKFRNLNVPYYKLALAELRYAGGWMKCTSTLYLKSSNGNDQNTGV